MPDESAAQINAAKAAYDALPDKNGVDATKLTKALAALEKLEQGGSGEDTSYSEYLKKALANIKRQYLRRQSVPAAANGPSLHWRAAMRMS